MKMEIFPVGNVANPNFKAIPVTENIYLVSTDNQTEIGTSGIFSVKVICGQFEILGSKLTPASCPVEVHSTKEFSLKISPDSNECKTSTELNKAYLKSFNISDIVITSVLQWFKSALYLLLISVDERSTQFGKYIESYAESAVYSRKLLEKSVISYDSSHNVPKYNSIQIHENTWRHLGSTVTKSGRKVVIAGGKNVGKSTLMKYLINRSLASHTQVLVLDFDPGQAEFTVMGCVSAVIITKPALGPNFSHLVTPVKSFYLGNITVADCSQRYGEYVEKIIQFCSSVSAYRKIPWFINTMGFNKGIGIKLLKNIIIQIRPTDVIQINSKNNEDNFPENFTKKYVSNVPYILQSLNYALHVIPSVSKNDLSTFNPTTSGTSPAKKREMVILSYFYQMLNPEKPSFTDVTPYKFSLNEVRIVITANDTRIVSNEIGKMIILNGAMVALCHDTETDSKSAEFKGFGIVRGVSVDENEIYINSPLSEEELQRINVIHMASTIQLPASVYIIGNCKGGKIPYMARIYPSRLNKFIKKSTSRMQPYDRKPTG